MEDLNNHSSSSDIERIAKRALRPSLIIQALAFTGILYFSVGHTPPDRIEAIYQPVQPSPSLSASIGNSVLLQASQELGLPTSGLRIVHAQPQTWLDKCLGLGESGVVCTPMSISGWQVAVASGRQRWLYRTNASGSVIKLERGTTSKIGKELALEIKE